MKKGFPVFLIITLIPTILFGCQSNIGDEANNEVFNNEFSDREITKVSISHSEKFYQVNKDFFAVYNDEKTLEMFQNAFQTAYKEEGVDWDMVEPEYDLEVIFKDGSKEEFHLWLEAKNEKTPLQKVYKSEYYYFSEEITNQIIQLIQ